MDEQKQTTEWPRPNREQPGQTVSYKSAQAGDRVLRAIDGLTPWAQAEVLQWALDKVRSHV